MFPLQSIGAIWYATWLINFVCCRRVTTHPCTHRMAGQGTFPTLLQGEKKLEFLTISNQCYIAHVSIVNFRHHSPIANNFIFSSDSTYKLQGSFTISCIEKNIDAMRYCFYTLLVVFSRTVKCEFTENSKLLYLLYFKVKRRLKC